MTRIESTAIIEDNVTIGENCYIGHYTVIRPGVIIGDNTEIRAHCFIEDRAIIGSNTQIRQFSNICAGTIIGDYVFIAMRCTTTNTKKISYKRNYNYIEQSPIIKYGARIGANVTILPGVIIGENSLIGAGSVVTKNTIPESVNIGVPSEFIKWVSKEEII